jgi:ABC-2 type transport system permease protein
MSFLMAGGYLAIACAMSALAGNQVTAFVLATLAGFVSQPPACRW